MRIPCHSRTPRRGSVLFAVLVVVVLLSLAAYQFSDLMVQELNASYSAMKSIQAKACADSGINYAAAVLGDAKNSGTNIFDNAAFDSVPVASPGEGGRPGKFSIYAPSSSGTSQGYRFGVVDESGKININALVKLNPDRAFDALMMLPNMSEEIADAIIDWIDTDEDPRPTGAEGSVYSGLSPGLRCKNGPLDSIEELLLVSGMTPRILFGTDYNRNGIQDDGEDDGGGWDPGLAAYLTVYSRDMNVDYDGNARVFLNPTNFESSYEQLVDGLGQELADFVILFRTMQPVQVPENVELIDASSDQIAEKVKSSLQATPRTGFNSRYELMAATVVFTAQDQQRRTIYYRVPNPLSDESRRRELLPKLLDKTTTQQGSEIPARVNVLTAPAEVLATLPGLTEVDVQNLLDTRPDLAAIDTTNPVYQTPAWMVLEANFTAQQMGALEQYINCRSQVYRVQSVGSLDAGGPTARVEAVIDVNNGKPRIVMWRDLTELGRGY